MNDTPGKTTRRSFFVRGGAALGAGIATAGTALAGAAPAARDGSADAADREAIRALLAKFLRHVAEGDYAAATALFDRGARLELSAPAVQGGSAIREFFSTHYVAGHGEILHGGYRRAAAQPEDVIRIEAGGALASATFAAEAELCTPLAATCTAAQMARLQGNVASRHWQPGRFDVRYVRAAEGWKIADLRWSAT